jgi:hypothetical protein
MVDDSPDRLERVALSKDVLTAHLEGEAVLLHLGTKQYYHLNETGAVIWKALEQGLDLDRIVGRLVEHFDVDLATATTEVERVLSELRDRDLLES